MSDNEGEVFKTAGNYAVLEDVYGYAIIFDADNVSNAKHFFITDEEHDSPYNVNAQMNLDADGSEFASNWTAFSTPEPTSGLLMLLGMASLALRRKRM